MKPITYFSEQGKDYVKALGLALTRAELKRLLEEYSELVHDAAKAMPKTSVDFDEFRKGLLLERAGKFAGEEFMQKYGAILMPEVLMMVGMLAQQYKAPFGTVFKRCVEVGRLRTDQDAFTGLTYYRWVQV